MEIRVPGYGPPSELMIIGEAPADTELQTGIPLTGPTGKEVEFHLLNVGIKLSEVYRTNVFKVPLPPSKHDKGKAKKAFIKENIKEYSDYLYREIKQINPFCILGLGDVALNALTLKSGIQLHRGSLLESVTGHKVIPTIHPSAYLQQWGEGGTDYQYKIIVGLDFKRAVEESKFREARYPKRLLEVARNAYDVYKFLDSYKDKTKVSLDIEAIKCIPVCIGLAFNKAHAMSIPILPLNEWNAHKIPDHELAEIWKLLVKFLNRKEIKFIGQNLKYDLEKMHAPLGMINSLERDKIYADTMLMMGTLYPTFPKSLAFQTSIFTKQPYYKDEGKEFNPKKDNFDQLFLYNAMDAAVTYEICEEQEKELIEFGLHEFYFGYVNKLHDFYTQMEANGIPCDHKKREELREKYETKHLQFQAEFVKLLGHPVNVNSTPQCKRLLYEELGLPVRGDASEDTIVGLIGNHCKTEKQIRCCQLIIDDRKVRKTIGTYINAELDYDGKFRTSVKIVGAETGRSTNTILKAPVRPSKLGLAFQTMTAHGEFGGDLREMMIAGENDG